MGALNVIFKVILVLFSPLYPIVFVSIIELIIRRFKGQRIHPLPSVNKEGFIYRLYFKFPRQLIEDLINRDPHDFNEYGLRMICGEQGSGKSITVAYLLGVWKQRYPSMKIVTNMGYQNEDGQITHWKDIIENKNDSYGVAVVLDEIQTWFSSLQSKDFPVEMLTEVSQQRKQRKCILGTAQVFSRISKPIREQTTKVYMPMTLFGCLTIVRETHAKYWDNENQVFKRYTGLFFYVHDKALRDTFDTFARIEKYKDEGFKSDNERLTAQ